MKFSFYKYSKHVAKIVPFLLLLVIFYQFYTINDLRKAIRLKNGLKQGNCILYIFDCYNECLLLLGIQKAKNRTIPCSYSLNKKCLHTSESFFLPYLLGLNSCLAVEHNMLIK